MFDFIKNIGAPELIIIALVLIVIFGNKKMKELAGGLGQSTKEFKKVKKELESVKSDVIGGVK